jgi:hypothetical protein
VTGALGRKRSCRVCDANTERKCTLTSAVDQIAGPSPEEDRWTRHVRYYGWMRRLLLPLDVGTELGLMG